MTEDLRDALQRGVLTIDQLRELIELRAGLVGMSFDAAVSAFREGKLPNSAQGDDLELLITILLDAEKADAVPA